MNHRIRLFFLSWLQIFLVAVSTFTIAKQEFVGALIVNFIFGLAWASNVKAIATTDFWGRLVVAGGTTSGAGAGMLLTYYIYI